MRLMRVVVLLALLQPGCSYRHPLVSLDSEEYRGLVRQAERKRCALVLKNGSVSEAESLQVGAAWTRFRTYPAGGAVRLPTSEVESITFVSRGAGAVEGAAQGLLAGASLGIVAGLVAVLVTGAELGHKGGSGQEINIGGEMWIVLGVLSFTPAGGILGAAWGAQVGHKDVYYPLLPDSAAVRSDWTPPDGPR